MNVAGMIPACALELGVWYARVWGDGGALIDGQECPSYLRAVFFSQSGGWAEAFYRWVRLFSFSRITSKAKNLLSVEYELA